MKIIEPTQQLSDIKQMMERSTRFISLSGLSGIMAGLMAIAGALTAFIYLDYNIRYFDINRYLEDGYACLNYTDILFLLADALVVLVLALGLALYFTFRKAKKHGNLVWTSATRRFLLSLVIPLATGGIFGLLLLYHQLIFLVAPATLIFYGMALLNAGKYTLDEIQWLGVSEIALGLIATFYTGYGLLFWAFGFGILHIVYGIVMYYRHERC